MTLAEARDLVEAAEEQVAEYEALGFYDVTEPQQRASMLARLTDLAGEARAAELRDAPMRTLREALAPLLAASRA